MTQSALGDPCSPAARRNAYPLYAHLRAAQPVHCVTLPSGRRRWLIARYDDAERVLRDPRLVKAGSFDALPPEIQPLTKHMLSCDPPDHTRLRALVRRAFSHRLVERLRPRIQHIADELLDAVAPSGQMDLIDDYAFPLPIMVICELLGVPSSDRAQSGSGPTLLSQGIPSPLESRSRLGGELHSPTSVATIRALFARKRADPLDDLISELVLVREEGDALSEEELLGTVFLLIVAGHETTVNFIGNGMLALFAHPDQLHMAMRDPGLIEPAMEELLRYSGPLETATLRYASTDIDRVLMSLSSTPGTSGNCARVLNMPD